MNEKILVGAPCVDKKKYATNSWLKGLMNINYPKFDIYISDNSHDKNYSRNLRRRYGVDVGHIEPNNRNIFQVITDSFNQIRTRFLYGNYSHLMIIEQDNEVLPDVVNFLLGFEKDIISLPYFVGIEERSVLSWMDLEDDCQTNRLISFTEGFERMNGDVVPCDCAGVGCTLIRREVLEQIPFRTEFNLPSDTFFYLDAKVNGFESWLATGVMVRHQNKKWTHKIGMK